MRFQRRGRPSGSAVRPSRTWADVSTAWVFSAQASTQLVALISLQAPTSLASLTSDPPEDLTILRVKGSFSVSMSAAAAVAQWDMALIVQDVTWTPSATINLDNDKRMLWTRTFTTSASNVVHNWREPGYLEVEATAFVSQPGMCEVDIAPKVKIEAGRALYLVVYETVNARTLTTNSGNMRVLFQRTPRRR